MATSRLWHPSGLIRLSVSSRGRAVPVVWRVIEHGSAAVSFATSQAFLTEAKSRVPLACKVVLLAERGVAETPWMGHLRGLGGHCRMRITSTLWMYPAHLAPLQVGALTRQPGHLSCWPEVSLTDKPLGPVHWAGARPLGSDEYG